MVPVVVVADLHQEVVVASVVLLEVVVVSAVHQEAVVDSRAEVALEDSKAEAVLVASVAVVVQEVVLPVAVDEVVTRRGKRKSEDCHTVGWRNGSGVNGVVKAALWMRSGGFLEMFSWHGFRVCI